MGTVPTDDDAVLDDDEYTDDAIANLDRAMSDIARGVNKLCALGIPQKLAREVVASRISLRWQHGFMKDQIPTFRRMLDDPDQRKKRGSSSEARSSQAQASKVKGKARRIKETRGAKRTTKRYFSLMYDAASVAAAAKRPKQVAVARSGDAAASHGVLRSLLPEGHSLK
jgi:hypothetical protein